MATLPLQGERRQTDQLLYPRGPLEQPSLCASHPQRRRLTHAELRALHRATPGVDLALLIKQVRQRRRFEPDSGVTADAFGREGQDIAVQVAHERADDHFHRKRNESLCSYVVLIYESRTHSTCLAMDPFMLHSIVWH